MNKIEKKVIEDIKHIESLLPPLRKARLKMKNIGYARAMRAGIKIKRQKKLMKISKALCDCFYADELQAIKEVTDTITKLKERLSALRYQRYKFNKRKVIIP